MKRLLILLTVTIFLSCVIVLSSCGHVHNVEIIPAVESTCTQGGFTEGAKCSSCGEVLVAPRATDPAPHNEEMIPSVESTCTEKGLTDGKKCSICGEVLLEQQELPLIAHVYDDEYDETCNECGHVRDAKCAHIATEVIEGKDSTCSEIGYTDGVKCSICGEIIVSQSVIDYKEHAEGGWIVDSNPTKSENGKRHTECNVCGGVVRSEIIPMIGSSGLSYTLNADGNSYSVTGIGTCTDQDIIIPSTYKNLNVTAIGAHAFSNTTEIRSVIIPETVIIIGDEAFWNCLRLTIVVIPNSVTSIGNSAFSNCHALGEITIPNSVLHIGDYAFAACIKLTSVNIPASVTDIGVAPFCVCEKLTSIDVDENSEHFKSLDGVLYSKDGKVLIGYPQGKKDTTYTIPEGVTTIAESAFNECFRLVRIDMPDSVVCISDYAFEDCYALKSIEFSDFVMSIGHAFPGCIGLENIHVGENNNYYRSIDGNLYTKDAKTLIQYAIGKKDNSFVVPDGVEIIGQSAFYRCGYLENVEIPDSVIKIADGAFAWSGSISNVKFTGDSKLQIIGDDAFWFCDSLVFIEIPGTVETIGEEAFYRCGMLTTMVIPNSVIAIGDYAFDNCDCLNIYCEASSQPNGWSKRWNPDNRPVTWGFDGCFHSEIERIPKKDSTCTEIGYTSGKKCKACGKILVAQEIIPLKDHKESDWITDKSATPEEEGHKYTKCTVCGKIMSEETIPVIVSDGLSFYLNSDYESYSVVGIGSCKDKDIVIPSTYKGLPVTFIDQKAFFGKSFITSVYVPDSVVCIGAFAFAECPLLSSVVLGDSIIDFDQRAFSNCQSLVSIVVSEDNKYFKSINGNIYTKDGKALILYAMGKQDASFAVPEGVVDIYPRAFNNCDSIVNVIIPSSVENIAIATFRYCDSLINICVDETNKNYKTIDGNLYSKDGKTFILYAPGKREETFVIPDFVVSIGKQAFYDCNSITSVVISDSVTSIEDEAFYNCESLKSIEISNSVTSIGYQVFYNCSSLTSVVIPDSVTSLGYGAFNNCTSLASVTISNSITSINRATFKNCSSLMRIDIPNSVTSILDEAFMGTLLGRINIPDSVTSIGASAFENCEWLMAAFIPDSVVKISSNAFKGCSRIAIFCESPSKPEGWNYYWYDNNTWIRWNSLIDEQDLILTLNSDKASYSVGSVASYKYTDMVIPDTYEGLPVTSVLNDAFMYCYHLTSVKIGNSVTNIGSGAFVDCYMISNIEISNSVTSIGDQAFIRCTSLESIIIPESVDKMGSYMFAYCPSITVYCRSNTRPNLWDGFWNVIYFGTYPEYVSVVWGYTGE